MIDTPESLFARCEPVPEAGCWLWLGAVVSGYGNVFRDRRSVLAHRLSWEIHNGRMIPLSMIVMHKCDTPLCINPDHLILGTHADNARDCVRKGRKRVRHNPKVTIAQANSIRGDGRSIRQIAAAYGISVGMVWNLKHDAIPLYRKSA